MKELRVPFKDKLERLEIQNCFCVLPSLLKVCFYNCKGLGATNIASKTGTEN